MAAQDVSTRDRIITAADALYEESGRTKFPSVDAVRRESKADMNSVSMIMKEWRHSKTTQVAPVKTVAIPESIQSASSAAMAELWLTATDLANQSLKVAQAGWDSEREELESMRVELANSCDRMAEDEAQAKLQITNLQENIEQQQKQLIDLSKDTSERISFINDKLSEAMILVETERTKTAEIKHRVSDLKADLEFARSQLEFEKKQLAEQAERFESELAKQKTQFMDELAKQSANFESIINGQATRIESASNEIATLRAAATFAGEQQHKANNEIQRLAAELIQYKDKTSEARERAERLTGSNETMQKQIDDLLDVIAKAKTETKPL